MSSAVVNCAVVLAAVTFVASGCNSKLTDRAAATASDAASGAAPLLSGAPARRMLRFHPIQNPASSCSSRSGTWVVWTGYGNPLSLSRSPEGYATGEIQITAGGAVFSIKSVRPVTMSVTPIPYAIVGTRAAVKKSISPIRSRQQAQSETRLGRYGDEPRRDGWSIR